MSISNPAMALPAPADLNTAADEFRLKSAAMRLLRRVLDPGAAIKSAVAVSIVAPGIMTAIHPFQPRTLRDYMVEAYHQNFCTTHDPNTPINPVIWKLEEPFLVMLAGDMMRRDQSRHPLGDPGNSQTPILPTAPILPPAPGQAPLLPCCEGGLSGVLPSRRGKRGAASSKINSSLTP